MSWPKVALILGLCAIMTAAWIGRWSDPVHQGDKTAMIIDRWTGDVWMFYSSGYGAMKAKIVSDATKEMSIK